MCDAFRNFLYGSNSWAFVIKFDANHFSFCAQLTNFGECFVSEHKLNRIEHWKSNIFKRHTFHVCCLFGRKKKEKDEQRISCYALNRTTKHTHTSFSFETKSTWKIIMFTQNRLHSSASVINLWCCWNVACSTHWTLQMVILNSWIF